VKCRVHDGLARPDYTPAILITLKARLRSAIPQKSSRRKVYCDMDGRYPHMPGDMIDRNNNGQFELAQCRADEIGFDPKDHVTMVGNPAEKPPYARAFLPGPD